MRRFLITSTAYAGDAEVLYDADGRLVRMDVSRTNMPVKWVKVFKEKVPAHVDELQTVFAKSNITVVEADYQVSFAEWWAKYDRKINKKRCEPLWEKMSKTDQVKAFVGVEAYNRHLKKESWRSKADPEKYLRDRYWENEWM